MAEATDTEMHQFLRLMFSPVAGNMVRTLFLNRQRAERELAPPEGLRVDELRSGALAPAWTAALAKARLSVHPDTALPADCIELLDSTGARHQVTLRVLADAATGGEPSGAFAVLTPIGAFGSVLEIVGADDAAAAALAALAQRLRALPYRTRAARSALLAQARANRDDADAQALAALSRAAGTAPGDPDFYDVATCVAGVAPAWSGGPFTHLWREHARLGAGLDATQAEAWARVEAALRKARA